MTIFVSLILFVFWVLSVYIIAILVGGEKGYFVAFIYLLVSAFCIQFFMDTTE